MERLVKDKPLHCHVWGMVGGVAVATAALSLGIHWESEALIMVAALLSALLMVWAAASLGFYFGAVLYSDRPKVRSWFWRHFPWEDGRKWLGEEADADGRSI